MNPYKQGDKVNYMIMDDKTAVYTVYHVYSNTHVSLGLLEYPDTEMDMMVHIANIQPA